MAGVVPFPGRTPGRKQWNIRDKKSMRRLRSQLAEDGCPESQLVLAKQLLEEKSMVDPGDNEENARLGVFWLIKASEQGNMEATNILRQCLETGEGITEHNYLDVKTCLNTLQNEKLVKRAAREMFISLSDGQDFITSEQLRRRMSRINIYDRPSTSSDKKSKTTSQKKSSNNCLEPNYTLSGGGEGETWEEVDEQDDDINEDAMHSTTFGWAERGENIGEKLTEDHLESAAITYSRGELPLVQRVLSLSDPTNRALQNLNFLQQALLHPVLTLQRIYSRFLEHFSSRYRYNFIPNFQQFQLLLIVLCYPFFNFENVLIFIPLAAYFISFFVMIVSTFSMLQSKREYYNFRVWSRLFLSYDRDGNLNTTDAEFEYVKKNLRPYGFFFLSLLVNLLVYPFVSGYWIPQSEFAILSFAFTFLTLYSFHEKSSGKRVDFLMLLSFGIHVLAKYPYETDGVVRQTWRFLDIKLPNLLPCFASYVVGNGIEFCLNFKGVFYLLMPGIFLKMASRENWKGTYKVLIPHCVTLAWWQIAVLCCQGATLYGLIRSALALVGFILFLPLVSLSTLVLPILAVLKHFMEVAFDVRTMITVLAALTPLLIGFLINKRRGVQFSPYFSKVQVVVAIMAGGFLMFPTVSNYLSNIEENREPMQLQTTFTWDQYSMSCVKATNMAATQIECSHFHGISVNWEGIVQQVQVSKVSNPVAKIINSLPSIMSNKLRCVYGEEFTPDCDIKEDSAQVQMCQVLNQVRYRKNKCHLNSWNRYDFEISIKIKTQQWNAVESIIKLSLDDSLKNFTTKLTVGDHVWFSGTLSYPETIASHQLLVQIDEIGCIYCKDATLTNMKKLKSELNWLKIAYIGVKYILNFLFSPVLIFR